MKRLIRSAVFCLATLAPAGAFAMDLLSTASGNWSDPNVWVSSFNVTLHQVPTELDDVTVRFSHVVTVDIPTAAAGTITVNPSCTLRFSTSASSALSLSNESSVKGGGKIEMGTPALPIPAGVQATLILPPLLPGFGWNQALTIEASGSFTAQGAAKIPVALSAAAVPPGALSLQVPTAQAAGWELGDVITIAQSDVFVSPATGLQNETETRAIAGLSPSGGVTTVSWAAPLTYAHTVGGGVRVANLTRNVVVRSSGTDVTSDGSAFTSNGAFSAVYAEFDAIGVEENRGFEMNGDGAVLSSCTVRDGAGIFLNSSNGTYSNNVFHNNRADAFFVDWWGTPLANAILSNDFIANGAAFDSEATGSGDDTFSGNYVYSNRDFGFGTVGSQNLVTLNKIYANGNDEWWSSGIIVSGSSCTVSSNTVLGNASNGIRVTGGSNVLYANTVAFNGEIGMTFEPDSGQNISFANDVAFSGAIGVALGDRSAPVLAKATVRFSGDVGVSLAQDSSVTLLESALGYDPAGNSAPDVGHELEAYDWLSNQKAVLWGCRINPLSPSLLEGSREDDSFLSFNQDFATGTVRLTGELLLSAGQSLALDHAQPTWASSATAPILRKGTGHAASVLATNDLNAVTQVVTVRCLNGAGNQWVVEGSLSGVLFGPFVGAQASISTTQFILSFVPGPSPRTEDRVSFLLMASSKDANRQKRLLFMNNPEGATSRLTVAPGASFSLKGIAGTPAILAKAEIDPVVIVSSGAFTVANATVTDVAVQGLWLSGSDGVSISSAVFNNVAAAGGSYITARDLVSNATFTNVSFLDATPALKPFNVSVKGADAGLRWYFTGFSGSRAGDAFDSDPNQKVLWADTAAPDAPGAFSAASGNNTGEISLSWTAPWDRETNGSTTTLSGGRFLIYRSTTVALRNAAAAAQAQTAISTTAAHGASQSYVDGTLILGATYYYRLWAADEFGTASVSADGQALPARLTPLPPSNFVSFADTTSISLSWAHAAVPPSAYRGPYSLSYSSVSAAGPWTTVSLPPTTTGFAHTGLQFETSYYYELFALDTGVPPFSSPVVALTARTAEIIPPQVSSMTAGPRAAGVALNQTMGLSFTKSMNPATVGAAVSLKLLRDHLGVPVNQSLTVMLSSNSAGTDFVVASTATLSSNTVYELGVSTLAADQGGKVLTSSATFRFVTLMDHTLRNVVTEGVQGASVDVAANALPQDGFLQGAAVSPSAADQATRKLVSATNDALRTPLPGGMMDLKAFDILGGLQPSAFAAPVMVSVPFIDADGDGIVDGTAPPVRVKTLSVYWLDEVKNVWYRLPTSRVDAAAGLVTAQAPHFTAFAAMGQADTDLSGAHAFPNPFVGGAGSTDVTFAQVGQGSTIRIYTASGRLVRRLSSPDLTGSVSWDLKNADGEPVVSALYLYRITSGDSVVNGKIGVVR